MSENLWHSVTVRIPFANNEHATIAKQVIEVDAELQRNAVKRTLAVEDNQLVATFDTLTVVRTIGEFAEEAIYKPLQTS
ncbi:hypothetical protein EDC04DRAFT_2891974 [Pisolithus marmoratus]|nr:hypothetical protein EDC04DRAFT_2891974 [Pisolithus marmoratus]